MLTMKYITEREQDARRETRLACPDNTDCQSCTATAEPCYPQDDVQEIVWHPSDVRFVAVYLEDQVRGGSEEGGWYYTAGTLEELHAAPNQAAAEALAETLRGELNMGRRSQYSVLSRGEYRVCIMDRPPSWPADFHYPQTRPQYE